MAEYIDKEALIKNVCYQYQGGMNTFLAKPNDFVQMVEDAPVLVLAGERHGHWEKGNLLFSICGLAKCSVCGDILVEAGLILDDNYKILAAHDGSRVLVDKSNPRTEIEITVLKDGGFDVKG